MDTEQKEKIIEELRELMSKAKYSESKTEQFCNTVADILQEIIDHPDEEREINYSIKKRIDWIEFRIDASGNKIDPLTDGENADKFSYRNSVNSVLFNPETSVEYAYTSGCNHIIVKSPSRVANSTLMNNSMVKAMLLGIVAGVFVRALPEGLRSTFLDGIVGPVMSTMVSLLMGIMGPAFFIFIIISISSLGSMEALSRSGKVILKRFILVSVWISLLTIAVALLFFPVFGKGDTGISVSEIESGLLSMLPKDFVSPFTEGNIPQIILLGIIFGIGLLMIGDSGEQVRNALGKVKEWIMGVMMMVLKILPLIPFISTMMIVANGNLKVFIQGWKYIAAAYVCYLLSLLLEFIAVSVRCRVRISALGKMLKNLAMTAFVTAMVPAALVYCYTVSENDMGIDHNFADLWISLSLNLLSPARTVSLVLSAFFIADVSGNTIGVALMIIMIITAVQLSLCSSGTVAGATVMLETLKMPTDMVGLFSAFEIFTRNAAAAYDISYSMLEELDAARESGNIKNTEESSSETEETSAEAENQ